MKDFLSKTILAAAFACLALGVQSAQAERTCVRGYGKAGPMYPMLKPRSQAMSRASSDATARGYQARRALIGNGATVGPLAIADTRVSCTKAGLAGLKRTCRARYTVCIDYQPNRNIGTCPPHQYYSVRARRCLVFN